MVLCTAYFYIADTVLSNHLLWGRNLSIPDTKNYSLMALLFLTALLVGKSVNGYPGGGETGGDEWARESIVKGSTCHADEQLNE